MNQGMACQFGELVFRAFALLVLRVCVSEPEPVF